MDHGFSCDLDLIPTLGDGAEGEGAVREPRVEVLVVGLGHVPGLEELDEGGHDMLGDGRMIGEGVVVLGFGSHG